MIRYFIIFFSAAALLAQSNDWQTYYEKSGYKETPRYNETVQYCKRLADASPWINYTSFGCSPQGRDIPLLIIDRNGNFTPDKVHAAGNVIFYIQAGIHSGEIDGKDAGLMLIRDIAITKKLAALIDHVTILFNPIFNVDGHERFGAYNRANQNGPEEMGWRVTAQNLDLNRDYLKADAPEMQSWLRLYSKWLPEFFADCHVTDGADYQYAMTYKIETHGILDENLIKWIKESYLPPLEDAMHKSGFPIIQYVTFLRSRDLKSGMNTWAAPPRFSDGYTAIHNRPGLLIETHMFKDYKTRVTATYKILQHTLETLNIEYLHLKNIVHKADSLTSQAAFRQKPFTLTYKHSSDSVMIDFLGYEYEVVKSELSGGDWYRFSDKPLTFRIPFFNKMDPDIQVQLPDAYIIPTEWQEVIKRIELHGIKFKLLLEPTKINVHSYRFKNAEWRRRPYEGRHRVSFEVEPFEEERLFPAGSVVIDMNQRAAKAAANILEPQAPDSYVNWGFFNAIFERKEYVESYVMEERARMMLASDEKLKNEFESKIKNDSTFAADPRSILMWFYQKSPYWDKKMNVYPVGKITDRAVLRRLELGGGVRSRN